jgi:UDP-N-acetylglucosamine:LPS N-acetylglucosamine transferase
MHTVHVVYFDAGGGHRSTALALADAIRIENRPWRVDLVNLHEVLAPIDILHKTTGVYTQEIYNWSLQRGWTQMISRTLPAMHGLIRLLHRRMVRELSAFWRVNRADLVVSVIPHFNRALHESVRQELPGTPLVTVMTDLADHPPHFWLEPGDQHFVCGSDRAVEQAFSIGIPEDQVWRVSGMAIHPRFYASMHIDRAAERERLGLERDVPTGLVLFGGYGSAVMKDIVERIAAAEAEVQLILLCGRNRQLAETLARSKAPIRRVVRTFTPEIEHYMHLSDFFIGKPGPGCVSEALAMKLPVIVERSSRTMVQERYNCDWIEQRGAGIVLESFAQIGSAVQRMVMPSMYAGFLERVGRLDNRAVFEITGILERILAQPQRRLNSHMIGVSAMNAEFSSGNRTNRTGNRSMFLTTPDS